MPAPLSVPEALSVPATELLPVIAAPPPLTVRPLDDVTPLQTRAFVVSNVMLYCPAFAPVKAMVPIRGDNV